MQGYGLADPNLLYRDIVAVIIWGAVSGVHYVGAM